MRKFTGLLLLFCLMLLCPILLSEEGLDPLRDGNATKHLSGPEIAPGALKGKVVLFEYWGYQ